MPWSAWTGLRTSADTCSAHRITLVLLAVSAAAEDSGPEPALALGRQRRDAVGGSVRAGGVRRGGGRRRVRRAGDAVRAEHHCRGGIAVVVRVRRFPQYTGDRSERTIRMNVAILRRL